MNSKNHYNNTKYQKPYNHKASYQKHNTHKQHSNQYTDHTNSNNQEQYQNHKKQYNQQQNQQSQQQFQQQNQYQFNKNNINNNNNYNKNININKQRLLTLQIENNLPTLQFTLTNISNIQSVTRDLCDDLLQSGSLQVYQVKNQCLQCSDIKLSNHYMASLVPFNPQVEKLMKNQKLDENHIYVSLNEDLNILIVFSHGDNQKLDPALEFQEEEVNIFCFRGFVTTQRGGDRYVNLFQNEDPTERLRINKTYDHVKKEFYIENKFNQQILQLQETKELQKKHSVYEFKEKIFQEQLQRQKDNKNIIVIDDEQEEKMREFEKQLEQKKTEGDEYYQKKIKELLDTHNPDYVGYTDEEIFGIYKGHNDIAIGYLNLTLQKDNELFDNYQKYLKQQIIQLDDEILHLKESIVFEQQDNFEKQEELQKLKFKLKKLIENKEQYKIQIQNIIQQSNNQLEQYQKQKYQQANEYFESLFQVKKNKLQQLKSVIEKAHQSKQQFEEKKSQKLEEIFQKKQQIQDKKTKIKYLNQEKNEIFKNISNKNQLLQITLCQNPKNNQKCLIYIDLVILPCQHEYICSRCYLLLKPNKCHLKLFLTDQELEKQRKKLLNNQQKILEIKNQEENQNKVQNNPIEKELEKSLKMYQKNTKKRSEFQMEEENLAEKLQNSHHFEMAQSEKFVINPKTKFKELPVKQFCNENILKIHYFGQNKNTYFTLKQQFPNQLIKQPKFEYNLDDPIF